MEVNFEVELAILATVPPSRSRTHEKNDGKQGNDSK